MLALSGLAVARGGRPVLAGLDLRLAPGEAVILRGPNGIGKTSLLRVIAGLAPPLGGQVSVAPDAIAYGAHADGVKAQMTAAENLRFWARVFDHPDPAGAARDALAAFALTMLADRAGQQVSAGQRRRLGLARLLVTRRPLWLLDEPTVSLDAQSVAGFAAVIRAHLARGGGALIATHIDPGLPDARVFDLTPFRVRPGVGAVAPQRPAPRSGRRSSFDEAFE